MGSRDTTGIRGKTKVYVYLSVIREGTKSTVELPKRTFKERVYTTLNFISGVSDFVYS